MQTVVATVNSARRAHWCNACGCYTTCSFKTSVIFRDRAYGSTVLTIGPSSRCIKCTGPLSLTKVYNYGLLRFECLADEMPDIYLEKLIKLHDRDIEILEKGGVPQLTKVAGHDKTYLGTTASQWIENIKSS